MVGAFVNWLSAMAIGLSDIDFAANDWFYSCFLSRYIKINNAVHGPVISDSKAIHTQLFGTGNKLGDATHAIEQAIFSVDVQMSELTWHRLDYNICAVSPKRRISNYKKFLYNHNGHRYIRALLLQFPPDFEAGTIIANRSKLKPEARMVDYIFVVHLKRKLGRTVYRLLDKGGASDDCSSI